MMYRNAMNTKLQIKFMTSLTKDASRKVFLILSNLRVHHGKEIKKRSEDHREQIEVLHLPSPSPELNPDEYLNGNFKNRVLSGKPVRNQGNLEKKTSSFMRTLIRRPAHVRTYCKHFKRSLVPRDKTHHVYLPAGVLTA